MPLVYRIGPAKFSDTCHGKIRGEQEISLYWITVIGVSAPFIIILIRMSGQFYLKKLEAVIVSLLMLSTALVFPSFLRREKILEWVLLVCGLLLIFGGVMLIRNRLNGEIEKQSSGTSKEEDLADLEEKAVAGVTEELENQNDPERRGILGIYVDPEAVHIEHEEQLVELEWYEQSKELEEYEEQSLEIEESVEPIEHQASIGDEGIDWTGEQDQEQVTRQDNAEFSLEQLIEKGFLAKEQGRYHLAAEWFILALDQRPSYDIAYYLIVEACEYWMNGLSTYDALDKVAPYLNEYIQNAPTEWGEKLMEWLKKEKLPFPGNYLGRID